MQGKTHSTEEIPLPHKKAQPLMASKPMTAAKRRAFVEDGVVVLPQLVPQELCRAAAAAIEAAAAENVGGAEALQALYHDSPLCALLQELLGGETQPVTSAQIAVRHPPRRRSSSTSTWASQRPHPRTGTDMWTALRSIQGRTRTIPTARLRS